jgi:hypothetical protein
MTKLADHLEHVHFIRGYPAKEKSEIGLANHP